VSCSCAQAAKVGVAIEEFKEEVEAVASKKSRNPTSAVAGEVLLSLLRLLSKALERRDAAL
jgi:hypothetical protein